MKLAVGVITVLLWPMLAVAQPPVPLPPAPYVAEELFEPAEQPQKELSTPEEAVRNFVAALEQGRLAEMWKYVLGARQGQQLPAFYAEFGQVIRPEISDVETIRDGKHAYIKLRLRLLGRDPASTAMPSTFSCHMLMFLDGIEWKIVPAAAQAVPDTEDNPLLSLASLLLVPDAMTVLKNIQTPNISQSNLHQLVSAVVQYVEKQDGKLALRTEDYTEKLRPFVEQEDYLYLPDVEPKKKYSFNDQLSGMPWAGLNSEIVLFYTGENGQLEFPYRDRAAVAFLGGHVRLVTREEAKSLRWKP